MTSLYEYAGGDEGLQRLEEVFYAKVLADPMLKPLFPRFHPRLVEHVKWFVAEAFGGPDRFSKELGLAYLIEVHRHLRITDEQRQRFVDLYVASLDEAGLPGDAPFREAVHSFVEFGSRIAQQISCAEDEADLHPLREVPRWTWTEGSGP
jgi:hemoglobin